MSGRQELRPDEPEDQEAMDKTAAEIRALAEAKPDTRMAMLLWAKKNGLDPERLTWGQLASFPDGDPDDLQRGEP